MVARLTEEQLNYFDNSDFYQDYMENFGVRRVAGMPFWTLDEDGNVYI